MIQGFASVFNVVDQQNEMILPGAFSKSLAEFKKDKKRPMMLWQHDPNYPIGVWHDMHQSERGLYVRGELVCDLIKGKEAQILTSHNIVTGLSIGYRVIDSYYRGRVRVISQVDLYEISIVTFPANPQAVLAQEPCNNNTLAFS